MNKFKAFLARKNIAFSAKRYFIDAMGAMAQGLFCTLLVGTILNTLGTQLHIGFLTESIVTIGKGEGAVAYTIGSLCSAMVGPGMAVAIGRALEAPPLVLFSLIPVGFATNSMGGAGGPLAVLFVAIIAAAAIGITYSLELWGGKTVPDVTGEAQADAIWLLESKGFAVDTSQVKSDEVEGIVLITDPAAGSRVPSGTTVNVSIATPRAVPDIVGSTQDEAKAAFEKEGLGNVTFKTVKSDEIEGTVLEVEPQAGTKVKSATAVTVTVAESYVVPDVTGKSQDDATAALKEAGYAVEVATKYSEDGSEGTVLSTDPAAETKLKSGSTVTITVSKSREKELISETYAFFSKGATVVMDGINYEVVSCDSVNYEGDGRVSYTITAKKFENTLFFGTIYGSAEQKSGTIKWNSDNSIASSNPSLKK